jgi:hypothetical protein
VGALPEALKLVSAVTSSLMASLRFVIAFDLAFLLLWILAEITYSVWKSGSSLIAIIFFFLTFVAAFGTTVWRCWKPQHFGATTSYSGRLNIIPLMILDAIVILAAILISDQLQKPFATPLLQFSQTMFHKLTG